MFFVWPHCDFHISQSGLIREVVPAMIQNGATVWRPRPERP
jgi:hypothetical protein